MKKLICWIKAIPLWLRTGEFVPHIYECCYEKAIIIATDNSFRVADNYQHTANETVYKDACLVRYKCIHCGHEDLAWYSNFEEKERLERD